MDEPIRFFLPGPAYVRRAIREALTVEVTGHRTEAFGHLYESVTRRLAPIFRTSGSVYIATSSSTLVMQAAIQSTVSRRLLVLVCGAFSERWDPIARSLGLEVDRVEVPWGEAMDADLVRQALRRGRYDAVAMAHNETSTGVLNDLEEIAAVIHAESDALIVVDAVSSLAGARLEVDAWDLDVVLTGAQKALALPPGLAFFTLSERAARRAEGVPGRGFYTDLLRYRDKHLGGGTITTPAVSLFHAADLQLDRILEEGIECRWERHEACREMVGTWAESRGLSFFARSHRSPTVSCLGAPGGLAAPDLVRAAAERGFTIGGGYGKLKPETFRLGHMGEITPSDVESLLECIDEILAGSEVASA